VKFSNYFKQSKKADLGSQPGFEGLWVSNSAHQWKRCAARIEETYGSMLRRSKTGLGLLSKRVPASSYYVGYAFSIRLSRCREKM